MTSSFICRCGYFYDGVGEPDWDHKPEPDSCCNCGGQKCTACVSREVHEQCANDCPDCCAQERTEVDAAGYRVSWSAEDGEYVATCAEFPSLSWLDADPVRALDGLIGVLPWVDDPPEPNQHLRAAARRPRRFKQVGPCRECGGSGKCWNHLATECMTCSGNGVCAHCHGEGWPRG